MAFFVQEPDMRTLMTITNCVHAMRQTEVKSCAALFATAEEDMAYLAAHSNRSAITSTRSHDTKTRQRSSTRATMRRASEEEQRPAPRAPVHAPQRHSPRREDAERDARPRPAPQPPRRPSPPPPPSVARTDASDDFDVEESALRYDWSLKPREQHVRLGTNDWKRNEQNRFQSAPDHVDRRATGHDDSRQFHVKRLNISALASLSPSVASSPSPVASAPAAGPLRAFSTSTTSSVSPPPRQMPERAPASEANSATVIASLLGRLKASAAPTPTASNATTMRSSYRRSSAQSSSVHSEAPPGENEAPSTGTRDRSSFASEREEDPSACPHRNAPRPVSPPHRFCRESAAAAAAATSSRFQRDRRSLEALPTESTPRPSSAPSTHSTASSHGRSQRASHVPSNESRSSFMESAAGPLSVTAERRSRRQDDSAWCERSTKSKPSTVRSAQSDHGTRVSASEASAPPSSQSRHERRRSSSSATHTVSEDYNDDDEQREGGYRPAAQAAAQFVADSRRRSPLEAYVDERHHGSALPADTNRGVYRAAGRLEATQPCIPANVLPHPQQHQSTNNEAWTTSHTRFSSTSPRELYARYTVRTRASDEAVDTMPRNGDVATPPPRPRGVPRLASPPSRVHRPLSAEPTSNNYTVSPLRSPEPRDNGATELLRAAVYRMQQASDAAMDASAMSTPGPSAADDRYALLVESARLLSSSVLVFTALAPGDRDHATSAARSASLVYSGGTPQPASHRREPHPVPFYLDEAPSPNPRSDGQTEGSGAVVSASVPSAQSEMPPSSTSARVVEAASSASAPSSQLPLSHVPQLLDPHLQRSCANAERASVASTVTRSSGDRFSEKEAGSSRSTRDSSNRARGRGTQVMMQQPFLEGPTSASLRSSTGSQAARSRTTSNREETLSRESSGPRYEATRATPDSQSGRPSASQRSSRDERFSMQRRSEEALSVEPSVTRDESVDGQHVSPSPASVDELEARVAIREAALLAMTRQSDARRAQAVSDASSAPRPRDAAHLPAATQRASPTLDTSPVAEEGRYDGAHTKDAGSLRPLARPRRFYDYVSPVKKTPVKSQEAVPAASVHAEWLRKAHSLSPSVSPLTPPPLAAAGYRSPSALERLQGGTHEAGVGYYDNAGERVVGGLAVDADPGSVAAHQERSPASSHSQVTAHEAAQRRELREQARNHTNAASQRDSAAALPAPPHGDSTYGHVELLSAEGEPIMNGIPSRAEPYTDENAASNARKSGSSSKGSEEAACEADAEQRRPYRRLHEPSVMTDQTTTASTASSFVPSRFAAPRASEESGGSAFEWMAEEYEDAQQRYYHNTARGHGDSDVDGPLHAPSGSESRTSSGWVSSESPLNRLPASPSNVFGEDVASSECYSGGAPLPLRSAVSSPGARSSPSLPPPLPSLFEDTRRSSTGQLHSPAATEPSPSHLQQFSEHSDQLQPRPSLSLAGSVNSPGLLSMASIERTPLVPSMLLNPAALESLSNDMEAPRSAALFADTRASVSLASPSTSDPVCLSEADGRRDAARGKERENKCASAGVLWVDTAGQYHEQPRVIDDEVASDGAAAHTSSAKQPASSQGTLSGTAGGPGDGGGVGVLPTAPEHEERPDAALLTEEKESDASAPRPSRQSTLLHSNVPHRAESRPGRVQTRQHADDEADVPTRSSGRLSIVMGEGDEDGDAAADAVVEAAAALRHCYAPSPAPVIGMLRLSTSSKGGDVEQEECSSMSSASTSPERSTSALSARRSSEYCGDQRSSGLRGEPPRSQHVSELRQASSSTQPYQADGDTPDNASGDGEASVDARRTQQEPREQLYISEDAAADMSASAPRAPAPHLHSNPVPRTRLAMPAALSKPPRAPTSGGRPRLAQAEAPKQPRPSSASQLVDPADISQEADALSDDAGLQQNAPLQRRAAGAAEADFFDDDVETEESEDEYCGGYGYGGGYMDV